MRLAAIATNPNLQLAWRRITTGSNHQYKRYFRHLYHAYELALEDNRKDLRGARRLYFVLVLLTDIALIEWRR